MKKGIRFVQSCIAHVGFPRTLREVTRAWDVGNCNSDLELLLDPPDGHNGGWTAPRWMTEGDILFFYHTKRAKTRIKSLLAAAKDPENVEWRDVENRAMGIGFLELQLEHAEIYCGTIFAVALVTGTAAFEVGDEDRFWRSNIYAPIDKPQVFENPLSAADFGRILRLTPGGALTPLNGQALNSLKAEIARRNRIPDFLLNALPGRLGFREIGPDNWMEIACSTNARFIDESQVRSYLIDFLLDRLKDRRTAIHQECRCEKAGSHSCFADYFVCIGGVWIPIEAKLNVRSERDLPRQISRYLNVQGFVPMRGAAAKERITGHGASYCLVIDSHGLYLVNEGGFFLSSVERPLLARTAINDSTIVSLQRRLLEMSAALG